MNPIERGKLFYRRHGLRKLVAGVLSDPTHLIALLNDAEPHFYDLELPILREDVLTFVRPLVDEDDGTIKRVHEEIVSDGEFEENIERMLSKTVERPDQLHSNWRELLYVLIRIHAPGVVVETGIFDGLSSAYLLRAIERNGGGRLLSIDIDDSTRMPSDLENSEIGWAVPDHLRSRWDVRLNGSREALPTIAKSEEIDVFLHDSVSTGELMSFEFDTVIKAMEPGNLILSDNVRASDTFMKLAESRLENDVYWKNTTYIELKGEKIEDRFGGGLVASP